MQEDEKPYLIGTKNRMIRYYFYLSNGLNILNEFRNLFLGIVAIYITLKLTNPLWMVAMTIPSLIVLTLIGYFTIHHIAKVKDWLGVKFGSHYGIKSFNYNKGTYELLEEIRDLLLEQKNK